MADENTTDTQNSTTDQADRSQDESPATVSSSSTTETKEGETLLGTAEDEKTEEKAGGEKTEEKVEDEQPENSLLGAPEGDYTITGLPEGMEIDTVALEALAPVAKEIGLSDAGMSKLAGVYAEKILPHVTDAFTKDIEGRIAAQAKDWDAQARLEIEGDGKDVQPLAIYDGKTLKEVRQVAAAAIDRLAGDAGPELRKFLEASGLGNNPALVRFAYAAGKAIKEDSFVRGDDKGKVKLTEAEILGYKN